MKGNVTKLILVVLLVSLLLAMLAVAACAKPVQAPAPAPTPSKALAPVPPAPKPAPPPATAPAPREQTHIDLHSGPFGGSGYLVLFALNDLINKNSSWLRATCIATVGSVENVKTAILKPETRKKSIYQSSATTIDMAERGIGPFQGIKYTAALRVLVQQKTWTYFWMTLNPNIKTEDDLVGKRVSTYKMGGSPQMLGEGILDQGMGIINKVKIERLDWKEATTALADGMIDVAITLAAPVGDKWEPHPALAELMVTKKKVYFIPMKPETVKRMLEKTGYTTALSTVPARALGETQSQELTGPVDPMGVWADAELSGDIAYEVTRIFYDYAEKFQEYSAEGKSITKKTLSRFPVPEEKWHPGSLRFFKEKGIKVELK